MGGSGSGYSDRDIKALKAAIEKEIDKSSLIDGQGFLGAGGFAGADGTIDEFPIRCPDGTVIDADPLSGMLDFTAKSISASISFEEYENKYSNIFSYDYCKAAPTILKDHGK